MLAVTGLRSDDIGLGYFGQRFSVSLWRDVDEDVPLRACHALVAMANEMDFPATSIEVTRSTYADLDASTLLAFVDDTGRCVAV